MSDTRPIDKMPMHYTRLHNAPDGVPTFSDERVEFGPVETSPGDPPVFIAPVGETGVSFGRLPAGWKSQRHPTPAVEWWVQTAGEVAVTASDGERRILRSGDVYVFENTTGPGHWIEVLGDHDVLGVFFQPSR